MDEDTICERCGQRGFCLCPEIRRALIGLENALEPLRDNIAGGTVFSDASLALVEEISKAVWSLTQAYPWGSS
jgi:hypothetical protein